jgi:hypothetical protein
MQPDNAGVVIVAFLSISLFFLGVLGALAVS